MSYDIVPMDILAIIFVVAAGATILFDLFIFLEWLGSPKWTDGKRHLGMQGGFCLMYSVMAGTVFLLLAGLCWVVQHVDFVVK